MSNNSIRQGLFAATAILVSLLAGYSFAQQPETPPTPGSATAAEMADFFSQVGNQIYEDCIFELSEEQIEVQNALVDAYIKIGATSSAARQLAVQQIEPPKLSDKCLQLQSQTKAQAPSWTTTIAVAKKPPIEKAAPKFLPEPVAPIALLADKQMLPQWDCASGRQYVTIQHKGYERKLTGGEICNPFDDVVRKVPNSVKSFRIGYVIRTGRLFVIADDPQADGKTIAWATSGRDVCRNNPGP